MSAPALPLVSVEEYLNTSYEHDMEFVDGVLVERAMPTPVHSLLQGSIIESLRQHRKQFRYWVGPECRVELVERSRYRIPDVLLANLPFSNEKVLRTVPLAVIEIWSPDDRLGPQLARFSDYWKQGVRQIIVFEPDQMIALRYENGALKESVIEHIELPDSRKIPFSSAVIFDELRSELGQQ